MFGLLVSLLPGMALAGLGIGGTQQSVCESSCNISAACRNQCLNLTPTEKYLSCLCQESCVDFDGVCRSCCNATDSNYKAYQDPFCSANVVSDLQTCNFYGNVAPNAQANVFQSLNFTANAPLPTSIANWVSNLPSPSFVNLQVSSTPDASPSATPTSASSSSNGQAATSQAAAPTKSSTATTNTRRPLPEVALAGACLIHAVRLLWGQG